jgi:hypothetical protein
MIVGLLAMAADLVDDDEPIHLIVGLPMRRALDGTPRMHIAVWTTPAAFAKGLKLTRSKETDNEEIADIRADMGDIIYDALAGSNISWCRVFEDRPEIITRRDRDSDVSWFGGKRVLLLGCGALGSWIGEAIARAGAATLHVLDNGIVKPGLLARQNFRLQDIGTNKAKALAARLKLIARISCEAFPRETHAFLTEQPERLAQYDVIVDCTASGLFQMQLERDWGKFQGKTPPFISIGIDARAERCLAVTLPANSTGGIWDAYLQLKRRLCETVPKDPLIAAFYTDTKDGLIQPEPGCSDPTFVGSTPDVSLLASAGLNLTCANSVARTSRAGWPIPPSWTARKGAGCTAFRSPT